MKETFFKNGFLTSTEAQNICNVSKEAVVSEQERLQAVSFYNTDITSILSPESSIRAQVGVDSTDWIKESVEKIGRYNALNAWLKEAIKAKEAEMSKIDCMSIRNMPNYIEYTKPEINRDEKQFTETEVINSWDADKLNKYYSLNSKAAAIGTYIHDIGSIAKARKDLNKKLSNPVLVRGDGRETVVYKYSVSVLVSDVESLFMSLLAEHRSLNAQLNKMKAEAKEEANAKNIELQHKYRQEYLEYDKKLSEYYSLVKQQDTKFAEFKISEKEKISKLKINVPSPLMATYNEIKALISE